MSSAGQRAQPHGPTWRKRQFWMHLCVTRILKNSSGGDTFVGGERRKDFKLCPNKSLEFVKRKMSDFLGIKYEAKNEGLPQVFILCWEEWKRANPY